MQLLRRLVLSMMGAAVLPACSAEVEGSARAAVAASLESTLASQTGIDDGRVVSVTVAPPTDGDSLSISIDQAEGLPLVLHLRQHSVRSPDFRVFSEGVDGELAEIFAPPVRTYRGLLEGSLNSSVTATLPKEGGISALIRRADGSAIAVEPVRKHLEGAPAWAHVVHDPTRGQHREQLQRDAAAPGPRRLDPGFGPSGLTSAPDTPEAGGFFTVKLALEVDYPWFSESANGDLDTLITDLETIVNAANVPFEEQLVTTHVVNAILVRSDEDEDPYTQEDAGNALACNFAREWDLNRPHIERDATLLFTGRNNGSAAVLKNASMCGDNGCNGCEECEVFNIFLARGNYGWISNWKYEDVAITDWCVSKGVAHELGHLWGAGHLVGDQHDPALGIMANQPSNCATTFAAANVTQIQDYIYSPDAACAVFTGSYLCGAPWSGSCYAGNGTPGCSDQAVCDAVGAMDGTCISQEWTTQCAELAFGVAGCGLGGQNGCDVASPGSPGCMDEGCCEAVCRHDDACCNDGWDGTCVVEASQLCIDGISVQPPVDTLEAEAENTHNGTSVGGCDAADPTASQGEVRACDSALGISALTGDDCGYCGTSYSVGEYGPTADAMAPGTTGDARFYLKARPSNSAAGEPAGEDIAAFVAAYYKPISGSIRYLGYRWVTHEELRKNSWTQVELCKWPVGYYSRCRDAGGSLSRFAESWFVPSDIEPGSRLWYKVRLYDSELMPVWVDRVETLSCADAPTMCATDESDRNTYQTHKMRTQYSGCDAWVADPTDPAGEPRLARVCDSGVSPVACGMQHAGCDFGGSTVNIAKYNGNVHQQSGWYMGSWTAASPAPAPTGVRMARVTVYDETDGVTLAYRELHGDDFPTNGWSDFDICAGSTYFCNAGSYVYVPSGGHSIDVRVQSYSNGPIWFDRVEFAPLPM